MAERRMFAKTIIDSDAFLELPVSSQLLYFHLSMRADDEGFINKPKTIMRMLGAKDDDMNILIMKKFIIPFESGVVVIKHWRIHNYLQNDRLTPTKYVDERDQLELDENKAYRLNLKPCIQNTGEVYTQVRLGKVSIGKNSKDISPPALGEFKNVILTEEEKAKIVEQNLVHYIDRLSTYIEQTGKKYKSHYATILTWSRRDVNEKPNKKNRTEMDIVYPIVTSTNISPEEEEQLKQAFEMLES